MGNTPRRAKKSPASPRGERSLRSTLTRLRGSLLGALLFILASVLNLSGRRSDEAVITLLALGAFGILLAVWTLPAITGLRRRSRWIARSLAVIAACCLYVAALWFFLPDFFTAKPLGLTVTAQDGNYTDGTLIDGIRWQPGLSALRVFIDNQTDLEYDKLEVKIQTDRLVKEIVQVGAFPGCMTGYPTPPIDSGAELTEVTGPGGDPIGATLPVRVWAVSSFAIRCNQIQRHMRVQFLAATVVPQEPVPTGRDVTVYSVPGMIPKGPRKRAEHAHITATYYVKGRLHKVEIANGLKHP